MNKRRGKKILAILLMITLLSGMGSSVSKAYFQRGSVGISLGKNSVTLQQGESASVSVSFSPSQSTQLPGCGMAECPQICGEKDCLDANGECKCAGTTYQTYYAFASVSSSNTSVATASYSNGVISIKAVSPGTTYITATASLRQFTSTSATLTVTVNAKPQTNTDTSTGGNTSTEDKNTTTEDNTTTGSTTSKDNSSKNESTTSKSNSSKNESTTSKNNSSKTETTTSKDKNSESVKVQSVKEKDTTKEKTTSEKNEENKTVDSDRGKITFVQIPDSKTGKEELESILGKKEYVDFQKKDKSETILYAWEFLGTELEEARDVNLNLEISDQPFEGCEYGSSADSIYLKRMDEEALPGKASTFVRVTEWFDEEASLNLYTYEDGKIELIEEGLKIENGYVTCSMYEEENHYILSTEKWNLNEEETDIEITEEEPVEEETPEVAEEPVEENTNQTKSIIIGLAVLLLMAGYVWFMRKKDTK